MQVDFIVIGNGLAGISFCEQLRTHNKTFVVFDDKSQQSSTVAGGLYNPVVLKRFTPVWKSKEQLQLALQMYNRLEQEFDIKLDYKIPVLRKFSSLEEQNDWFSASDNPLLSEYLSINLIKNTNQYIDAPFGYGEVMQTGRIDVKTLMDAYRNYLQKDNRFIDKSFNYQQLEVSNDELKYADIHAKHIVFTEGYGVNKNLFFQDLPLLATKGELLTIYAPNLKIDFILKSSVFIIPLGDDYYIVGATYNWDDTSNDVTLKAKEELLNKLKTFLNCPFEVVNHVAGIRPTVRDRRPLVGQHSVYKNMYVLNGLGTRGVMIGPYVANQLFEFIEFGTPLENEIDIKRFQ
ncbi:FAD-dependent oxidoreductase [Gaetbulibacter sp. M235]|uniref:NAD(P)/FAD-dependent oxidoreductase n=1 Tax=Gaetbulibacter sp. M235 TaxID=3126510 RepID=UPI00374ED38C